METEPVEAEPMEAEAEPAAAGADAATIFVSIASYRDPEAPHTIRDLFEKASHPQRCAPSAYRWPCMHAGRTHAERDELYARRRL